MIMSPSFGNPKSTQARETLAVQLHPYIATHTKTLVATYKLFTLKYRQTFSNTV
jgi:hypothetical protein